VDLDLHLTPHFTLRELAVTTHREFLEENVAGAEGQVETLRKVCEMLEVVRAHYDAPVSVHSGYRCLALNASIPGASSTSQHMKGEAADFHVYGEPLLDVWTWIKDESGLPYGQLILEGRAAAGQWGWIHLSLGEPWRPVRRCRQAFKVKVD
jgi:zinc D-Ala-D-Ala carboxypeptidase